MLANKRRKEKKKEKRIQRFIILVFWYVKTSAMYSNELHFFPLSYQDDKAFIEKSLEDSEQVQVKHCLVHQSGNYLKYHLF